MGDIIELIDKKAKEVEKELGDLISTFEPVIAEDLFESMKYSLFSGGKRLRPILAILSAELTDGDSKKATKIGASIEMIHTYSLIHDDLPSMDDDDYRRGKKANHLVYGSGMAILAGDALLTATFELISKMKLKAEKKVKIIRLISKEAGLNGMVGGQALDLKYENKEINLSKLKKIHLAKTAALFRAAIVSGAYTGDINKKEVKSLKLFSKKLGLLFQITDDILDLTGDSKKLGKEIGSDSQLDKSTYPKLLGLEGAKKEAKKTANKAKESLAIFGGKADKFKDLIDFILTRDH
ncbi:MAG: polyprenyl synthetase family protein [Bacillota bacterium]